MKTGQLVFSRGIHPFYVDMDFQDFCRALQGWKIEVIEEDDQVLNFIVIRKSFKITIGFSKDNDQPITFSDLVSVESDDTILPDGRALAEIGVCEFEKLFTCKLTRDEPPELQIKGFGHWSYKDKAADTMIFVDENLIEGLYIFRDPASGG